MADQLPEPEAALDPFEAFPPEWREPVVGLAFLGQMTDEFKFCGHSYVIKTLKPQSKIAIGTVLQPVRNTLYEELAWRAAHVGVALMEIDGRTDFCPATTRNIEDFVRGRIDFISNEKDGWEPPLIQYIWDRYARLELMAAQMVLELDSLLTGSLPTSSPWLDSSNAPGLSDAPMSGDTPISGPSSSAS